MRLQPVAPIITATNSTSNVTSQSRAGSHKTVPLPPGYMEEIAASRSASATALRLILQGQTEQAFRGAREFSDSHNDPATYFDFGNVLVNSALIAGHYDYAYQTILDQMSMFHNSPGHWYLQLSLASAAGGQAYPGQLDYVEGQISKALYNRGQGLIQHAYKARGSSAAVVASASCLALGLEGNPWVGRRYLEMALQFDKGNYWAASALASNYYLASRFSDAVRVCKAAIRDLPPGKERDYFADFMKHAENRPDDKGKELRAFDKGYDRLREPTTKTRSSPSQP